MRVSDVADSPASGYFLDIRITNRCATEHPVEIIQYRYSGLGYRGTQAWNKDTSVLLTSDGKNRLGANSTRAKWVHVQGAVPDGTTAGMLMMGHPGNRDHPELLRTWDNQHEGAIFINFNPVQEKPWIFEPGKEYTRCYRLYIYDGELNSEQINRLWKEYAENE